MSAAPDFAGVMQAAHARAFSVAASCPAATLETLATQLKLIESWEHIARSKFRSAAAQDDEFGRKFIEHGATCYFNCAQELRAALAAAAPAPAATA